MGSGCEIAAAAVETVHNVFAGAAVLLATAVGASTGASASMASALPPAAAVAAAAVGVGNMAAASAAAEGVCTPAAGGQEGGCTPGGHATATTSLRPKHSDTATYHIQHCSLRVPGCRYSTQRAASANHRSGQVHTHACTGPVTALHCSCCSGSPACACGAAAQLAALASTSQGRCPAQ